MCDPVTLTVITMGATAAAGGMTAYGQYKQGAATNKYLKAVANINEEQGRLEVKRGEKQSTLIQDAAKFDAKKQKTGAASVAASARAVQVANGIDLSSVTAEDLATDTINKSRLDELAIRYNADVSSWNVTEDAKYKKWTLDQEAENKRAEGRNAKAAGKRGAFTTLLGTAASMAGTALLGGMGSWGGGGTTSTAPKLSGSLGPQNTGSFLVR